MNDAAADPLEIRLSLQSFRVVLEDQEGKLAAGGQCAFDACIQGGYEAGPNAVLAFAREGYRLRDVNLRDLAEMWTCAGFWRMGWKYWRTRIVSNFSQSGSRLHAGCTM